MGTRALQSGGKAKAYQNKGATATCPKCCSPGGCCICANPSVPPDDPCYISYDIQGKGTPPSCNASPSCCCGSRIRVTWHAESVYDSINLKKNTGNFQTQHVEQSYTSVFEVQIVTDPNGKCREEVPHTRISFDSVRDEHDNNHYNGQDHFKDTHDEDHDKDHGDQGLRENPQQCCRPEPIWMACRGGLPAEIELYSDDFDTFCQLFFAKGCSGTSTSGFGKTTWNLTAGCKTYRADLSSHYLYEDNFDKIEKTATGIATMFVEVLVDDCCDKPGIKTSTKPTGPVNPGDPSNPARPGFVLVLWAGLLWRGTPILKRWWTGEVTEPGCGCIHFAKSWWERLTGRAA